MPQRPPLRYPGTLGERLPAPKGVDALPADNRIVDIQLAVSFELALLEWEHGTELENRMALLFDHFEIPQPAAGHEIESWRKLAFKLAEAGNPVPGFQRHQLGRVPKWKRLQIAKLYVDVQRKVREGQTERQACSSLAVKEPWRSLIRSKSTNRGDETDNRFKTLHRRYKKTKQTEHIIISAIKELEKRWPGRLDEILQIASEQLKF